MIWSDDPRQPQLVATGELFDVVATDQQLGIETLDGVVSLGKILPETALRLSALLAVGLLAEKLDEWSAEDAAAAASP